MNDNRESFIGHAFWCTEEAVHLEFLTGIWSEHFTQNCWGTLIDMAELRHGRGWRGGDE